MKRMLLLAGTALLVLNSSAYAGGPCTGPWPSAKEFALLSAEDRVAELQRLADGLNQGCSEAMNGLGYLTETIPADYPAALRWFSILIKVSETQSRQISVQSALVDQFLEKINALTVAVEAANTKAATATEEVDRLNGQLNALTAERNRLNGLVATSSEALKKARIEVAALADERSRLAGMMDEAKRSANEASETFQKLLLNYEQLNGVLETKMAELTAAKSANDELTQTAEALTLGIGELQLQIEGSGQRIAELEAEKTRFQALVSSQALKVDDLGKQIKDLQENLSRLASGKAAIEDKLSASLESETDLRQQIDTMTRKLDADKEDFKKQLEMRSAENEALDNARKALIEQVAALTDQQGKQNARLSATQSRLQEVTKKLRKAETAVANLHQASTSKSNQITALTAELADEKAAHQESLERLKSTAHELANLQDTAAALENNLGAERSANDSLADDLANAQAKLARIEEELAAANASIDMLKAVRSEFYARLIDVLEGREDIQIIGDRFVFQSEILFDSGSADLSKDGQAQIEKVASVLREIEPQIPTDLKWVLQVNGHTDDRKIRAGGRFIDNWQLSTARALSVVRFLGGEGVTPEHLSAAGYGEFQPVAEGSTASELAPNRRIELKLTD